MEHSIGRIRLVVALGLVFGLLDLLPMVGMDFPDEPIAMTGAFVNRFPIGFLLPLLVRAKDGILRGQFLGFLLSLPDAIITGAYVPIPGFGVLGGLVLG